MSNQLKMSKVHCTLTLQAQGWSYRRISRELGIHRNTVRRYVRLARSSDEPPPENQPNPPTGYSGSPSQCEHYREVILASLEQGLSSQRIWQDLRQEHGFEGSYNSVKRFVRRMGSACPLPFRRTHVLRVVLSHSRKGYSEVVYQQITENFIRCIENAFHHFGGVPRTLIIDNLKAAVTKADWFDPDLKPGTPCCIVRSLTWSGTS